MRALVVDDSRFMRAMLGGILRQAGFEVAEASDGRDGLQQLSQLGEFELALVDWNMPGMDGLEFTRAVRADPSFNPVRLMMVTMESEIEQVSVALELGADEYVMKPFDKEIILDKLALLGLREG